MEFVTVTLVDQCKLSSQPTGTVDSAVATTKYVDDSVELYLITKTADYTILDDDHTILIDGTSNTVTITLPNASTVTNNVYNIKCINDTFTVDISSAQNIDGDSANIELINMESITLQSDGSNWWII